MISEMKLHRVPPFLVVGNSVNANMVHDFLTKENMKLIMQWSAMACSINDHYESPEISDFHIEQVKDFEKLDIYLHLLSTQLMRSRVPEKKVFEKFVSDPSVTLYLAYLNGEPVGTALLFVNNDVAGIYMVSVHESVRSKGIGKALTAHMMNDASQKACKLAILHATKDGERVYRKFGFEEYGKINIYWLVGKEFI
jgi:ribosomal protein S18 acetylase RimI-like enzyme